MIICAHLRSIRYDCLCSNFAACPGPVPLQVRQLKAQTNTLADQASQAKMDLAAAKQESEVLQDQIVQVGQGVLMGSQMAWCKQARAAVIQSVRPLGQRCPS